ncbi:MAG: L,D-transpeptidase [Jatrophihabitantaceae bacterium]
MRKIVLAAAASVAVLAACSSAAIPAAGPASPRGNHPRTSGTPAAQPVAAAHRNPAHPRPNRCAYNRADQKVIVSVRAQHMWLCARHRIVRDSPITSGIVGAYTSTPTGNYEIQGRTRDTTLTLITGATYDVKYWIPFDGPLFGFHDSSWQRFPYGSPKYRTQGSHGCIHLPLPAIAFLYRWAVRPTAVHIA